MAQASTRGLRRTQGISLREFVRRVAPRFQWYTHIDRLARVLERVERGELQRVMVFMPPRHGKSLMISQLFTAWYLQRHPDRWVGINSYAAELAFMLSRNARDFYCEGGMPLKADAAAMNHWETSQGGGLWAAGVGGPISGKGFHVGIIDDPLKNAEEANSATIREKQKDWYRSTFYTREEPGGAIVIVQTRWHLADLSGWLLEQEGSSGQLEGWHVVSLPAIAEGPSPEASARYTVEADWRQAGEALCPERYPLEKLRLLEGQLGAYWWNALYQQRPLASTGTFFDVSRLEVVEALPAGLPQCRAWDLAATPGGDRTAGVRLAGPDGEGRFYVVDVVLGDWPPDGVRRTLRQTAELDGRKVPVHVPQDPGQAGKDQAQQLVRLLAGFQVRATPVTGDKATRAGGLAAQANAGNVRLLRGVWNRMFIDELQEFPLGAHDDQVDGASDAFNRLTGGASRRLVTW